MVNIKYLVLTTFLLSACRTPQPTVLTPIVLPTADSQGTLVRQLKLVPRQPELLQNGLWFADYVSQKRTYGFEAITSASAFQALPREQQQRYSDNILWLPHAAASGFSWALRPEWPQTLGYEFSAIDRQLYANSGGLAWARLEGPFAPGPITRLLTAQGYTETVYHRQPLWSRLGDAEAPSRNDPVGRLTSFYVNRITVDEHSLTAASTTALVQASIDAQANLTITLAADADYAATAQALGPVVAAALMPPERYYAPAIVAPDTGEFLTPRPSEIREQYHLDDPNHPRLHPYRLVGWGYQDTGAAQTILLALAYTDPAAATADAQLLHERLLQYHLEQDSTRPLTGSATIPPAQVLSIGDRTVVVQPLQAHDQAKLSLWFQLVSESTDGSDTLFLTTE